MSVPMSRAASLYGYAQQERHAFSEGEDDDDLRRKPTLPPLPQPPSQFRSVSKGRRERSSSASRLSSFFQRRDHQQQQFAAEHDAMDGFRPASPLSPASSAEGEESDEASAVGIFSRQARSAARQARTQGRGRSLSQPEPPSPALAFPPPESTHSAYSPYSPYSSRGPAPPSPTSSSSEEADSPNPLFAPSLSPHQLSHFSRASSHLQAREAAHAHKEAHRETRARERGLFKVAVGVVEMVGEERREARQKSREEGGRGRSRSWGRGRGKSHERERTSVGAPSHPSSSVASLFHPAADPGEHAAPLSAPTRTATLPESVPDHLLHVVEAEVAARVAAITGVHPSAQPRAPSRAGSVASQPAHPSGGAQKEGGGAGWKKGLEALEMAGGAAAALGLVGAAGMEWWEHRQHASHAQVPGEHGAASIARPSSAAAAAIARPSSSSAAAPGLLPSSALPPPLAFHALNSSSSPSIPRPLSTPPPNGGAPTQKVYLSSLTPQEHHLLRHAAAAMLLKDKARGTLHGEVEKVVHGVEHLVEMCEEGVERAWHSVKPPKKLFGTPLALLTHHEGTLSQHGADPSPLARGVRVPEFVDHCITALKLMDVTAPGIFRKSGNLRVVDEIIHALDTSGSKNGGGKDTVIDLAALDPVTLADIFKKFLAALPHPLLTGHLFKLYIACSHIKHPNLRRRAMHLVVCLMPRVNRDVMEIVFLFLDWLSTYAHVDIKVGNQMDLSSIAVVMAPVLLRPNHRPPKPIEYKQMVAAVLALLEDQHVLHEIPYDLAHVLHLEIPPEVHHGGSAGLVQHLARLL
ncbi:hypothetical protein JCM6882_002649 [Rhodosporidiobolus microsporus]